MKEQKYISELFNHLRTKFDDNELNSETYTLSFDKLLHEIHSFTGNFDKGAHAFEKACERFVSGKSQK